MKDLNQKVGNILRKCRFNSGYSLAKISILAEISSTELKHIETGRKSVRCDVLYRLIKIYKPTDEVVLLFCCPQLLLKDVLIPSPDSFLQ